MRLKEIPRGEERSAEQLIEHYELEKELAGKLKKSTKVEWPKEKGSRACPGVQAID